MDQKLPPQVPVIPTMMSNVTEDMMVSINLADYDISCLNEEIDLGLDVKIPGLGDSLPIPKSPEATRQRTKLRPNNVVELSKTSVKPKDRDKSKVVHAAKKDNALKLSKDTDIFPKPIEQIKKEYIEDSDLVVGNVETRFYGNRIILGRKSNVKTTTKCLQVVLKDCTKKLKSNKNFCHECQKLFMNTESMKSHKQIQHGINAKSKPKRHKSVDKQTETKHDFRANTKRADSKQCHVCLAVFSSKASCKRHLRNVHNIYPDVDSKKSSNNIEINNEKDGTNNETVSESDDDDEESNPQKEHKCSHCAKVFPDKDSLSKHLYDWLNKKQEKHSKSVHDSLQQIRNEVIDEAIKKLQGVNNKAVKDLNKDEYTESDDSDSYCDNQNDSDIESYSSMNSEENYRFKCPQCTEKFNSQVSLEKHNLEHTNLEARNAKDCVVAVNNLSLREIKKLKEIKRNEVNDINIYRCKSCKKYFETKYQTMTHIEKSHPDKPIMSHIIKIDTIKVTKRALFIRETNKTLIPKNVLFKCNKCDLHFLTTLEATIHVDKCPGPKLNWNCPDCYNDFKPQHQEMHEKQHLLSDNFLIHAISGWNLDNRILSKCPKCGVHFAEIRFWRHYKNCGDDPSNSIYCSKCDILIDFCQSETHESAHGKFTSSDFIIIDYETTQDLKRKLHNVDEAVLEKRSKYSNEIQDENSSCSACNAKILNTRVCQICRTICKWPSVLIKHVKKVHCMKWDAYSKIYGKKTFKRRQNDKNIFCHDCVKDYQRESCNFDDSFETTNLEAIDIKGVKYKRMQMLYCNACDCYIDNLSSQDIVSHFELSCHKMAKTMCKHCGLIFSCNSFALHEKQHEKGFFIRSVDFFDMRFNPIPPLLPNFPRCYVCMIFFLTTEERNEHSCKDTVYIKCQLCKMSFSTPCEEVHRTYHFYTDDVNVKSAVLSRKKIAEIQKILLCDLKKKLLYQCVHCEATLSEVNVELHQKLIVRCDKTKNLRKCQQCKFIFTGKDYPGHIEMHENGTFDSSNIRIVPFDRASDIVKVKRSIKDNEYENREEEVKGDDMNLPEVDEIGGPLTEESIGDTKDAEVQVVEIEEPMIVESNEEKTNMSENHDTQKEIHNIYQCKNCNVNFITETKHSCLEVVTEVCESCELRFTGTDFEKHSEYHNANPEFGRDQINVVFFVNEDENQPDNNDKCVEVVSNEEKSNDMDPYKIKDNITASDHVTVIAKSSQSVTGATRKRKKTKTERLYKCACGLHFMTELDIFQHFSDCDSAQSSQKCPKCNLSFTPSALFDHLMSHSKNRSGSYDIIELTPKCEKERDYLYSCGKCKLHFLTKSFAEAHIKSSCESITSNSCQHCGLNFDKTMLKFHIKRHHSEKKFSHKDFDIVAIEEENEALAISDSTNETIATNENKTVTESFVEEILETVKDSNEQLSVTKFTYSVKRIFKCYKCDLHFISLTGALKHLDGHRKSNLYAGVCEQCHIKFANIKKHVEVHHDLHNLKFEDLIIKVCTGRQRDIKKVKPPKENVLFQCTKCDIYYTSQEHLYRHVVLRKHDHIEPINFCETCKKHFGLSSFRIHVSQHREAEIRVEDLKIKTYPLSEVTDADNNYSDKVYKCKKCTVCFMNESQMAFHKSHSTRCPPRNVINCEYCDLKFMDLTFFEHIRYHHDVKNITKEEITVIDVDKYKKNKCKEPLSSARGNRIYKCKNCDVYYLTRSTCEFHVTHHKPVYVLHKMKCKTCQIYFHRYSIFKHIKRHHEDLKLEAKDLIVQEYDHTKLGDGNELVFNCYPATDNVDSNLKEISSEELVENSNMTK